MENENESPEVGNESPSSGNGSESPSSENGSESLGHGNGSTGAEDEPPGSEGESVGCSEFVNDDDNFVNFSPSRNSSQSTACLLYTSDAADE